MRPTLPPRPGPIGEPSVGRITTTALALTLALVLTLAAGTTTASAAWNANGVGSGAATTGTLSPPTDVVVLADSAGDISVGWTPATTGVAAAGYVVTRHSGGTAAAACGSSVDAPLPGEGCVDRMVADGEYTYVVTAVLATWTARSVPSSAVAVSSSVLGAARSFSVLAGTAVVSTGATVISGDLGVSPGSSVTGFGPGIVGGDVHAGGAVAASAHDALEIAYADLSARAADRQVVGDLGGLTLGPGVHHTDAALDLTGTLTLDAGGDPNAVFIFQTGAAFTTAALASVVLVDGASPRNVYWVVAGAAGTGAGTSLSGTIVAVGAITLGAGTLLIGHALSLDAVTLAASTIRFTTTAAPTIVIDGGGAAATQDVTPTISGSSDAPQGSIVHVTSAGGSWSTSVGASSRWSVDIGPLEAGPHDVVAKVRDADGNGSGATQILTVQVDPPTIDLATAATFSALATTSVVNTGATRLSGDLGVGDGGSITGFPPGVAAGTVHVGDVAAEQALADIGAALDDGSSRAAHTEIIGDLGGRTFSVGVHHSTAALSLTGTLTLDANGDPDATFIFQTDAAFDTAAGSRVVLVGGAQAANVFWVVTGAAGTGANSVLVGTVLARGAITLGATTRLTGAALSQGAVTLAGAVLDGTAPAPAMAAGSDLSPPPVDTARQAYASSPMPIGRRSHV